VEIRKFLVYIKYIIVLTQTPDPGLDKRQTRNLVFIILESAGFLRPTFRPRHSSQFWREIRPRAMRMENGGHSSVLRKLTAASSKGLISTICSVN
jgi:hypothetical protein